MINKILSKVDIKEILKFIVGGGSAVIVDCATYYVFKFFINFNFAKIISFVLGALVGFVINKFWTFKGNDKLYIEIIKYIVLYSISLVVNTLVNNFVYITFNVSILAFLVATGASTIINFVGQKFIVFSKKK